MEWVAVKVASVVVADAEGIRDDLVRRHGPIPNCKVLTYGTCVPDVNKLSASNSEISGVKLGSYYLVVCRMEPENHVIEIVEGFLQAKTSRRLVIVGDVNLPTSYARRLREINDPRVVKLGAVYDRKRLDGIRAGAHAYLHGHSVGGTNPSLLEAMSVGNVIVAHDNVFNREVTAGNGLFFRDADGVAHCIELIEALPAERRAEWVRLGLQRAGSVYSWERVTEQYLLAFNGAVGR
jgi:glycosyltransferase involved in cell wall biosynthesis